MALRLLKQPVVWVVLAFVLSRLLAHGLGVRFETAHMRWFWQFADLQALTGDYLGTLLHLHSQPPLFNAFVGAVLLLFGDHAPLAFQAIFLALGLGFALAGHQLLVRLGVGARLAAGLVIAFIVSPSAVLYESWLFYTYPVAALLTFAALALHRFASSGRKRDGLLFFGLLAALALLRSLFHLVYLFAALGILLWAWRHERARLKNTLVAFMLPCALVLGLYAKNAALFGTFGASSWLGMSLYKVSTVQVPRAELEQMAEAGRVSQLALHGSFQPITAYPKAFVETAPTGQAVLDQPRKSNGSLNFNHRGYVKLSNQYKEDGLAVLKARPTVFAKALAQSYAIYFRPSHDFTMLEGNQGKLGLWNQLYDRVVYGRVLDMVVDLKRLQGWALQAGFEGRRTGLVLLLALPLLWLYGMRRGFKLLGAGPERRAEALVVLFMGLTILYVTGIGNALEIGENNRFRFGVDFFYLTFLGLALGSLGSSLRRLAGR